MEEGDGVHVRTCPECLIPLYFSIPISPCMHVLIVSSGWVTVAPNQAPWQTIGTSMSSFNRGTRCCWLVLCTRAPPLIWV